MKKINLTLTLITCLIICNKGLKAQGHNLEFEQAIFNTYNATGDGNFTSDVILTQTLIVPPFKVLKISSHGCSFYQTNGAFAGQGYLSINNVSFLNSAGDISLPAGTYTIKISDQSSSGIIYNYTGHISGILYNIVP